MCGCDRVNTLKGKAETLKHELECSPFLASARDSNATHRFSETRAERHLLQSTPSTDPG